MTYDALEKSEYGGRPAELYRFTKGITIWRYTDSDVDVTINNETFKTGLPISRTEPELSREEKHSQLKITTSINNPVAQMYATGSPGEPILVTVLRTHTGDPDLQTTIMWQGKVRGCEFKGTKGEATLTCDPVDKSASKMGFRQTYGPACNKKLYSPRCGVAEASYYVDITITAISTSGFVISAAGFGTKPNNWFLLGEVYFSDLGIRMKILSHVGNDVTITKPITGLAVGSKGRAIAGCNHIWRTDTSLSAMTQYMKDHKCTQAVADAAVPPDGDCYAKFSNPDNFGGWPFVPSKNPYQVSIEG